MGELIGLIKDELNVKEVLFGEGKGELKIESVELDTKITPELKEEGEAREIIRGIQEARKTAGCRLDEVVEATLPSWPKNFENLIKKETLTSRLSYGKIVEIKRLNGQQEKL